MPQSLLTTAVVTILLTTGVPSMADATTTPATTTPAADTSASASADQDDSRGVVAATSAHVDAVGHWGRTEAGLVTVNSGARLAIRFTGHTLRGLFDTSGITNPPQIYVSIDGRPPVRHVVDADQIDFTPTPLAGTTHTAVLTVKDVDEHANRWVPPLRSGLVVTGFRLDAHGHLLGQPPRSGPRIEFYGDSITQGVKALGNVAGPDGSDGTATYSFRAGQQLGARVSQIGFGRQGIIRTGNGNVPPAPESLGWNFQGSPARPFHPDAVVVNQGTNDAQYDSAQFRPAYLGYLRQLRAANPTAWIFAMRPFGGAHGADIAEAVRELADDRVVYVDTTGWLDATDYTDTVHPTVAGHQKAADRLVPLLRDALGC
ncbi:SGNH/GDSL hydrolase family protein [Goodfellowiella coeruleoviolacea]|uniref:Lysophospholipase L1 n=1 Tax=Goodfellowiella coeruleoviolacea TaxID=334858 RepID=A0AAE3GHH9_9PSEU|nr:SGNH/GDSL hydrolase family protein [Goodfellowiella coeruleoviolacea]MCP2167475.1 Lysophospholipase L1 [Goodfellowiella coeruleoviolacea]